MRRTIGWVLIAVALAACGTSGDVPATDADPPPETTQATAAATTSTRPLYSGYSDADYGSEPPTTAVPTATPDAEATITIENFSFGSTSTVGVGDRLIVVNEDGVPHTWTSEDGAFDSGTLGSGDTFEYVFDEAGEYSFFCEIHPSMTGTITVTS